MAELTRQKRASWWSRLPLVSIGILLLLVSMAPTVIAMRRIAEHQTRGDSQAAADADVQAGISLAFHPLFITCNLGGVVFIVAGLCRGLIRPSRPWKEPVAPGQLNRPQDTKGPLRLSLKRIGAGNIVVLGMTAAAAVLVHYWGLSPVYGATLALVGLGVFLTDQLIER
jgi:hypothetical protein